MVSKALFFPILFTSSLLASTIQSINFIGNVNISSGTLQKNIHHHLGKTVDENRFSAIIQETENYYRKHNYALAFATVESAKDNNSSLTVTIGKYADFNERSIAEMKRRPIEKGVINQIFFEGNEKVSTYRLMNLISPMLGKTNTQIHQEEIVKLVQTYYRTHRYALAYATLKKVDDNGILTIEIKKYPNFKALYALEGQTK